MKRDRSDSQQPPRQKGLDAVKSIFSEFRSKIIRRADGARRRLLGHSIVYGATNLFLLLINFVIGISFPWFLFPLGGWAILLAGHAALARQRRRQGVEVTSLEELSTYQTRLLRRFHRRRAGFALTSWSSLVTALFLGMTNLIVSPHFPWALITAGALGLGELLYYLSYSARRATLLNQMREELPPGSVELLVRSSKTLSDRMGRMPEASSKEVLAARQIRGRIARQLADLGASQASVGAEITPLLDRCVDQIGELVRRREEIAALVERSAPAPIEQERERLTAKLEEGVGEALRAEYLRTIDQLDRQLSSINELNDHLQIAELRLNTAMNSLTQIEIDVVRMKGVPDFEGSALSKSLEEQTQELARYLEDMKNGWKELE